MASKSRIAYLCFAFIILVYAVRNWHGWLGTSSWIFQERDLNRAAALLHGHYIAYGPETTGGGHLFGPLYYFCLVLPAWLGLPWKGAWYLMQAFTLTSGTILWFFLRKNVGLLAASFAVVFLIFSDWVRHVSLHFYNASFVAPFVAAATVFLLQTFLDEKANAKAWFCFLLAVGLGCQMHASIFVLLPVAMTLQLLAPQLDLPRLTLKQFALGFAGLLLPLLPFLIWKASTLQLGLDLSGNIFDVFKAMTVITQTPRDGTTSLLSIFTDYVYVHTPCVAIVLVVATALSFKDSLGLSHKEKKMIRILLVQVALTFPLLIYHTFASNAYRYIGGYVVATAILAGVILNRFLASPHRRMIFNCLMVLFFALNYYFAHLFITNLESEVLFAVAIVISALIFFAQEKVRFVWAGEIIAILLTVLVIFSQAKASWNLFYDHPEKVTVRPGRNKVLLALSHQIYQETGWSYEEARLRIFFVNMHVEQGLAYPYMAATLLRPRQQGLSDFAPPDGYIVSTYGPDECDADSLETCRDWILKQEIPDELKRWITNGEMVLENPEPLPKGAIHAFLIPYHMPNLEKTPPFIQNVGYAYSKYPGSEKIESHVTGAERDLDGQYVFRWNECQQHKADCASGMIVQIQQQAKNSGRYRIHVRILGQSLSHSSEWFSPRWTEGWIEPFIELQCHGHSEKIALAQSIGWDLRYGTKNRGNLITQTNSILAPFERIFERTCPGGFSKISAGRTESTVVDTDYAKPLHFTAPILSLQVDESHAKGNKNL